jgi:hypothetical protein
MSIIVGKGAFALAVLLHGLYFRKEDSDGYTGNEPISRAKGRLALVYKGAWSRVEDGKQTRRLCPE